MTTEQQTSTNGGQPQAGFGFDFSNLDPMAMKLLGLDVEDEITEAVWEDGVPFGTTVARSGDATIGLIHVRVVPPTPEKPTARLVIDTNGPIYSTPDHLRKLARFFQRVHDEGEAKAAYTEVAKGEQKAQGEAVATQLIRREGGI